uniref:Transposase n=1 Tax=Romanomermis culicivorax TaxID=13658 RepID=A0A915KKI1_ROMCU
MTNSTHEAHVRKKESLDFLNFTMLGLNECRGLKAQNSFGAARRDLPRTTANYLRMRFAPQMLKQHVLNRLHNVLAASQSSTAVIIDE